VYGYPGSQGTIWSNYRKYVFNQHPFLSLCCLHPKHVYSRKQRLIVYFDALCFAIFLSYVLLGTNTFPEVSMSPAWGCNGKD
jgi:hypothetical protein